MYIFSLSSFKQCLNKQGLTLTKDTVTTSFYPRITYIHYTIQLQNTCNQFILMSLNVHGIISLNENNDYRYDICIYLIYLQLDRALEDELVDLLPYIHIFAPSIHFLSK